MHFTRFAASLLCVYGTLSLPTKPSNLDLVERQSGSKIVTAHFMVGLTAPYTSANWQQDIAAAQAMGIDAFALNIADQDSWTNTQLALAYGQAQSMGFKLFISFDFAWFDPDSSAVSQIVGILQTYAGHAAALKYNNKAVVSTFIGDNFGTNWNTVRSQVSTPLEILPNWQPSNVNSNVVDGAFSWNAWPNSNNNPIAGPMTTAADNAYISALGGKPYMAPVSPWFFTHFDGGSWNKNWIFASDDLYVTRWNQILSLAPPLLEIVTWNDFGESSYIGPYNPGHGDDGSSQWAAGFPHDAWRTLGKPYIAAYKAGASSPTVTSEKIIYWYRPHPKGLTCSSDSLPKPTGWDYDEDKIFIATMLTSPAQLVVQSGSNSAVTINVAAGIVLSSVSMATGAQTFKIRRNNCDVISGTGGINIAGSCQKYNFNAYVGEISPSGTCTPTTTTTPPPPITTTTTVNTPPPSPSPTTGAVCNHGQGDGNFAGLCDFSCYFGYCPSGVCTCTSYGAPNTPPPETGQNGIPAPGLGNGYSGLCSFACNHGYCPSGACVYA